MVAAGLLVLSLFSLALGKPLTLSSERLVVRSQVDVPTGFSYQRKATAEQTLNLRIALTQNNATGLESALYDVSDPTSENYGHHLTKAEVRVHEPYHGFSMLTAATTTGRGHGCS